MITPQSTHPLAQALADMKTRTVTSNDYDQYHVTWALVFYHMEFKYQIIREIRVALLDRDDV